MSGSEETIWDPISSLGRVMPPSDFMLDSSRSSFSQTKKNWPERLLPRPSTPQTLTHRWNSFSSELPFFKKLWRFVSVAGHKIRLQIEKSPFPDTVPGLHHKKPAEVRLDKKDLIMRLKEWVSERKSERAYTKMRKIKGEYRIRKGYKSNTTVHWRDRYMAPPPVNLAGGKNSRWKKKRKKTENATKEIVEWSEEEKERHWKFKQKMKLTVTRRQSLASTVGCW